MTRILYRKKVLLNKNRGKASVVIDYRTTKIDDCASRGSINNISKASIFGTAATYCSARQEFLYHLALLASGDFALIVF